MELESLLVSLQKPDEVAPAASASTTMSNHQIFRSSPNVSRTRFVKRLPTLDETSSSEDSDDPGNTSFVSSSSSQANNNKPPLPTFGNPLDQAHQLASTGREDQALTVYKKALQNHRRNIQRIKQQLQQKVQHPSTQQSIATRLHQDWMNVGLQVASIRTRMAVLYERCGNYAKALDCANEAAQVYSKQQSLLELRQQPTEHVVEQWEQMQTMLANLKQAQATFAKRQAAHEALWKDPSRNKAQQLLDLETQVLGDAHPQVAETMALLAQQHEETTEKVALLKQAFDILQVSLGNQHPRTGHVLVQLARATDDAQYYHQALRAAHEPSQQASIHNDLALWHLAKQDLEGARAALQQALDLDRTNVTLWRNLAECQDDCEKAVDALLQALSQQRQADDHPEAIAETLRRLGKVYTLWNKPQKALLVYKEALLIQQLAVRQAMGRREVSDKQDQLANTMYGLAQVQEALSQLPEASRLYSESMQLRLFSDAHRQEGRRNMVHCAMCLVGIGGIHVQQKEWDEATRVYKEALTYCEGHGVPPDHAIVTMIRKRIQEADQAKEATENHTPEKAKPQSFQAQAEPKSPIEFERRQQLKELERRADGQAKKGDWTAAIQTLTRVMSLRKDILKQLKAAGVDATNEKLRTAATLHKFGRVLGRNGDGANAERAYKDAIKMYRKCGETAGPVDKIVAEMNQLQLS